MAVNSSSWSRISRFLRIKYALSFGGPYEFDLKKHQISGASSNVLSTTKQSILLCICSSMDKENRTG
ncbi:MAG TPA: hypothetical protein VFD00_07595 [Thermoclostridium sp.]|nr:hypothetical protein [Thermoclostridium sp.]